MKLVELPEPDRSVSVEHAFKNATESDLQSVIIAGYTKDGTMVYISSRMTVAESYYLLAQAQDWVMGR